MGFPFEIIDLSHTLSNETPGWELGCGFSIKNKLNYEDCNSDVKFKVQHMSLPAGIGTHIDAPAHCNPDGDTIEKLGINNHHLIAQGIVIDVSTKSNEQYLISALHQLRGHFNRVSIN
ncbi:cyclase family protein [Legionella nagasakiensis]|uniref:cyclase family protein n=1 Tax=Legionella nagasakiensis TaxID=535290 RepID=UPI0013EF603E|nr:cyclase family protein [Legionella nagasakiensis]